MRLFILQLIFNFTWSIFFFYMQNPLLGFINIILLEFLIIVYSVKSYGINKISSILFIPYILWVTYATYLNLYILICN
ncbi:TspO/MBR family protein [Coprobacter fastidiosus]|uniref:TspO/MBR family protein n=1 Tax=Coprobacter fastidiosus TaxID=1099853 RepID=UPI0030800526